VATLLRIGRFDDCLCVCAYRGSANSKCKAQQIAGHGRRPGGIELPIAASIRGLSIKATLADAAGIEYMIEDPRERIDYDEAGQGPTVVLVPGSCSTGAAWRCRRRPPPDSPALFRNGLA
jgi:hypothetical protein